MINNKYEIPKFKITELLTAMYGSKFTDTGSGIYTFCPITKHSTPGRHGTFRVYPENGTYGTYVCPCGIKGTVWDFLEQHNNLPGWRSADFDDTILFICDKLNVTPVLKEGAQIDNTAKVRQLYIELHEALTPIVFKEANEHYQFDQDKSEWLYRGLHPMLWYNSGIGMLNKVSLDKIHNKWGNQTFTEAGLKFWKGGIGYDWMTQGVYMTRKSRYGSPCGMAVRRYSSMTGRPNQEAKPKYIKNSNNVLMESSMYLLGHNEIRNSDSHIVYITEGEFDKFALSIRGFGPVISHGSGQLTKEQMNLLNHMEKQPIMICDTDANGAGFNHAKTLSKAYPNMLFIFLPVDTPGGSTDPDTYAQTHGVQGIASLDIYSAMQVRMFGEQKNPETGKWSGTPQVLAQKYMLEIAANPSAYDERNVETVAHLSGSDAGYLRNWLFTTRNHNVLNKLSNSSIDITLR